MIPMPLLMIYGVIALIYLVIDALFQDSNIKSRQRYEEWHRERIKKAHQKYWAKEKDNESSL